MISTISLLGMSDGRLQAIDSHDWYWLGSFFKGGSLGRKPCSEEMSYCSKLIDGGIATSIYDLGFGFPRNYLNTVSCCVHTHLKIEEEHRTGTALRPM